jgi:hypothetical protein
MPFTLNAQDSFMENFLNDVAEAVVSKDFRYFYYVDYGFGHNGEKKEDAAFMRNELLKKHPDFPKGLFETSDTTSVSWEGYTLKRGRAVTSEEYDKKYRNMFGIKRNEMPFDTPKKILDSLNALKHDEVYAAVKEGWSHDETERAMQKAMKDKQEELRCFRFCRPVFSADKKYAIIQVNTIGTGRSYIFKRNGNKWVKLEEFRRWIS